MEAKAFGVVEGVVRFDESVLRRRCEVDKAGQEEAHGGAAREDGEGGRLLPTAIFTRWRAN